MALYVTISINDDKIQTYGATRIGEEKNPGTYRVCKYVKTKKPGVVKRVYMSGTLVHDYNDGAVVLARKLLSFVLLMGGEE